jgi:SAM-dependent methyltransferase
MSSSGESRFSLKRPEVQLFVLGAAILFWELLLIRWLGACIRIVGYYTNFVLISAFFGLGTGALLVRLKQNFLRFLVPLLALIIVAGPLLGSFPHVNPTVSKEFLWLGTPTGVIRETASTGLLGHWDIRVPYWFLLLIVYLMNSGVFALFGEWLGRLFGTLPPLKAYTIEIAGSLIGILLFGMASFFHCPPTVWFILGFILVFSILADFKKILIWSVPIAVLSVIVATPFANQFFWSRYYKIHVSPIQEIKEIKTKDIVRFNRPIGHQLSVNNDYHQMILDLSPRSDEHPFLKSWRITYDSPYYLGGAGPDGPILIVGAGTGNDVSAALRAGVRQIDAVEIDPMIVALGRDLHPEKPYSNSAVHVTVDDARSFFARTNKRYSKVIFGFLDSHTLMSSFSSLRLDNFIYTEEALRRVKELLLPGGRVYITFAANTPWLEDRIFGMLTKVFDGPTVVVTDLDYQYSNGTVYMNEKSISAEMSQTTIQPPSLGKIRIPSDNWPYLYMRDAKIPSHYVVFLLIIIVMGMSSLLLLPKGERQVKLPYFFMGAAFFLLETSNVVSLSLLYGSTWLVNITVFSGILFLILLGNLTCYRMNRPRYGMLFTLLIIALVIAYFSQPAFFLSIKFIPLQGALATLVFLGPVYLASLIFGHLIKSEKSLYQAYGSNLLGAVIGGSCEYLSILIGLKSLLLITMVFYGLALVTIRVGRRKLSV